MDVTFITGNEAKAREVGRYLGYQLERQKVEVPEIQSLSLEEVVRAKASAAYAAVGTPVLVEDTELTFAAIQPLPGPFIKWFLESLGNEGLCNLVAAYGNQAATARTMFCAFDGTDFLIAEGECAGSIAAEPRGATDFGWDPIFIPQGEGLTWAEMDEDGKERTSMRKKALVKLKELMGNR